MTSLRERQLHMTQLLKKLDRMIAEKHGKYNLPFCHYQKPLAPPGERESVCVYLDAAKREYLPFGVELEKMVEDARLWVRTGEGIRPEVMIEEEVARFAHAAETTESEKAKQESARARASGSRRRLIGERESADSGLGKQRLRPPA